MEQGCRAGLFTGPLWEKDAEAGQGSSPLSSSLGLFFSLLWSGVCFSAVTYSKLPQCSAENSSWERSFLVSRDANSFHSHLQCTFYFLASFNSLRVCWATTVPSKAFVPPVSRTWAQPCPSKGSICGRLSRMSSGNYLDVCGSGKSAKAADAWAMRSWGRGILLGCSPTAQFVERVFPCDIVCAPV